MLSAQDRSFYSWLLIWSAAPALCFGWLFLVAGTGVFLLGAGLLMIVAGVLLRVSWARAGAGFVALVAGCSPLIVLLAWAVAGG